MFYLPWGDTSCPVCRYCQTPEEMADQISMQCGSYELHSRHTAVPKELEETKLLNQSLHDNEDIFKTFTRHLQDIFKTFQAALEKELKELRNKLHSRHTVVQKQLEDERLLTKSLNSNLDIYKASETALKGKITELENKLEASTVAWNIERREREQKLSEIINEKHSLEEKNEKLHLLLTRVLREHQDDRARNQELQTQVTSLEAKLKEVAEEKDKEIIELKKWVQQASIYIKAQLEKAGQQQ
ncbi:hypothetical protein BsWGS_21419 [Bradybaena similaris]